METGSEYQSRMDGFRNENLAKVKPFEEMFKELLDEYDIFYIRESKRFSITEDIHRCYFMDFYIPYYNIDIEIDGKIHDVSKRRKGIDKTKTKYLKNQKDILTVRVSNDKVEEMYKKRVIDWNVVFQDISKEELIDREHTYIAKTRSWKKEFSRLGVDTERPIFLYYACTDHFYHFDNILELRRSLHLKCGKVIYYIDYEFKSVRAQYFISWDEEILKNRVIDWKKKYNK
jgi:very-short-patch-repair endonuclease